MRINIFVILILSFFISCQRSNPFNVEKIDLTSGLKSSGEPLLLSNFANKVQYIFLETSEESLIDHIDKIMIDDSLVFLFNKNQLLVFNTSGHFVREIGKIGKGPGEFLRIIDFTLDTDKDKIYIYDWTQTKVMRFTYQGIYEMEFTLGSYPMRITSMKNKQLVLSWVLPGYKQNNNYGLSFYSMDGKFLKNDFNRENENFNQSLPLTSMTRLNYCCDSLTYWEVYLDIIYRINENGKMVPRYKIDYQSKGDIYNLWDRSNDVFRYNYYLESNKYLFFLRGLYNGEIKHLIVNKSTHEVYNSHFDSPDLKIALNTIFINDIDGGIPFSPVDLLRDGRLYSTFYPYELKSLLKREIFNNFEVINKKDQKNLYSRIEKSKDLDNPVIMLVNFK